MPNYSESLPEVFSRVAKAKNKDDKMKILRENDSNYMKTILQGAFDPRIEWALPDCPPPYKPDDAEYGLSPSVIEREMRKLTYFLSGRASCIANKAKRESVYIRMLESIHKSEAELIIAMVARDLNKIYKGLTHQLVWETFPDIVPEPEKRGAKA